MPGINETANADKFFGAIADAALPLLKETKIEGIGFTFSYPSIITPDLDGIVLNLCKEVDAPEVIGKAVGKGLRDAFSAKGYNYDGQIVILNDTVATLLSGYVSISPDGEQVRSRNDFGAAPGPAIGLILGTGFNTAYPETRIPKINFDSPDSPQIINCETGCFNVRYRGKLDKEFDSTTKAPGTYLLEKGTAGAYLGPLTLYILKQAIKDKVIRFKNSDKLLSMQHLETKTLNEFIQSPLAAVGQLGSLFENDESDAVAAVQYIISIITERGALFSAAVLAAAVERMSPGFEPYSPVRIAVEGTTYKLFKGMRRALESNLHQILYKDKPRPYVILPVEQASLFGAAMAALSKKN
jgi:hexokinase